MDYKQFETKVPYPNRADYTRYCLYYQGERLTPKEGVTKGERDALRSKYPKAVEEIVCDQAAYKEARDAYYDSVKEGERRFREYLEEEYGTKDNLKKGTLYAKAWDLGHSCGFSEVEHYYADLVDLIL